MKDEILRRVALISIVSGYLEKTRSDHVAQSYIDCINLYAKEISELVEGNKNESK